MVVITGYYAKPDQVDKTETITRGTEVLFATTSDRLPSQITKDGQVYDRGETALSGSFILCRMTGEAITDCRQ